MTGTPERALPGRLDLLRQTPAAIVVGVGCGLTLLGLSLLAELLQDLVWDDLSGALGVDPDTWWWIVAVLTATGLLVGLVVRFAPGHAGPDPATAELISSPLPASALPGVAAALVLMLAGGVSLGPENPIMLVNGSLTVLIGLKLLPRVAPPEWLSWSVAGTIGAMFGTPVAAALMLTEAQPGDPRIPLWNRLFAPLVSAASGSATMLLLSDMDMHLDVPGYEGFHLGDVAWAVAVALLTALLGLAASYLITPLHRLFQRITNPVLALTVGGFVLGWLGVLGGRETLFKGLDEMKSVTDHVADYSNGELALMVVVKLAALLVAAASSFRGGRIFPAVFVGVVAGWTVTGVFDSAPPAVVVAAGALGITIAATRSGWLSLFLAATVVPDVDLLPILLIATLAVWLLVAGRHELRADPPVPATGAPDPVR
ncbi:ion channel protein [Nocardioides sp. YIM 152315]|uniref:ion channel protein n=1 Tax=Nocardioides sp. YIM 152315 TaxID=3031760 RepID=UPI0023DAB016|nr:ion channel protein [Nocardioides sp. YIM 152315]MDF1603688.1 ion channel protein [Nocardioides sp. YIM 152315]